MRIYNFLFFFFFNDTATTEIYTLSLHDALPIFFSAFPWSQDPNLTFQARTAKMARKRCSKETAEKRSEEHTSELQSQSNLVCRLLLEKKKNKEHTQQARSLLSILKTPSREI